MTRADRNNNPAAITTDVARQGGLLPGVEFVNGDPFPAPSTLITAKLIGDPIALTIRVLDKVGYFTRAGTVRWTYIDMPKFVWDMLTNEQKRIVIRFHYAHEGGTTMLALFK